MRLALVTASLGRGGAERVLSVLANAWVEQGKDVTMCVLNRDDEAAYPLRAAIKVRNLRLPSDRSKNAFQAAARTLKKVLVLRSAIASLKPDVIVSFMDYANILTLLATRRLGIPVIVSERIDPSLYKIGSMWEFLRRRTYPAASAVVCQTQATLQRFQQKMPLRGCVIPNPVVMPYLTRSRSAQDQPERTYSIVAMGRLVPQKGFDLLINAFSQISERHSEWVLKIAGSGPLQQELQQQAAKLNLKHRVILTGALEDPFALLTAADLFVLSSRFEGFPNALCEAMACGLPVISFDCPAGPREIIRDGVDGLLVDPENVGALAEAMDTLMTNPAERARLASRAIEIASRFSKADVLKMWDELFCNVLSSRAPEKPASVSVS
jgi:GalNAc-alpha-(1->4)-GalNAc-alpha-(1->3)-diNAcBac-PP-undecaprenol alpha-1,4-N-acetyl-D-galactosaminyltransferase